MRILVTGANGYLGQGIVKELLDGGENVIAVGHKINNIDERAERIEADIFMIDNPFEYFGKPDEIGFFEGSINEETPCHPITPYGIAKNALRDLTEMLCKKNGVKFQWLRGYYIVGNSVYGSSVFSKITAAVLEGKKKFPFTMGQNQYDFIDYSTFCKCVAAAVCQEKTLGIIEICSGKPEKLANRAEHFIKENGYSIMLEYGAFPDRPYDSKAIWGDSKKIEAILERGRWHDV